MVEDLLHFWDDDWMVDAPSLKWDKKKVELPMIFSPMVCIVSMVSTCMVALMDASYIVLTDTTATSSSTTNIPTSVIVYVLTMKYSYRIVTVLICTITRIVIIGIFYGERVLLATLNMEIACFA